MVSQFLTKVSNIQWVGEATLFNKQCWQTWICTCRNEIKSIFPSCIKIYSKWIKHLRVKPEMPKLPRVKENMSQNKSTGMDLLNRTLVAKETAPRTDKGTCMGFQSLCKAKQTTRRVDRLQNGRKIFAVALQTES